jgi:hypothetical protein
MTMKIIDAGTPLIARTVLIADAGSHVIHLNIPRYLDRLVSRMAYPE